MIGGRAVPETASSRQAAAPQRTKADKVFSTLQAKAALAGFQLMRSTDDRGREVFIASQWALTAQFETMAEVGAWLQRVEELTP